MRGSKGLDVALRVRQEADGEDDAEEEGDARVTAEEERDPGADPPQEVGEVEVDGFGGPGGPRGNVMRLHDGDVLPTAPGGRGGVWRG